MPDNDDNDSDNKDTNDKHEIIRLWTITIVIILIGIGTGVVWLTYENTHAEFSDINEQINPSVIQPGLTNSDYQIPENAEKVYTGVYVDNVKSLSLKDDTWTVDFYIWFNWNGHYNPGNFQIIDASNVNIVQLKNSTEDNQNYSLYKVTATISKTFDMFRFPVDQQFLTIDIQDSEQGRQNLVYIPDNADSIVGPEVIIPGYTIDGVNTTEKPYLYNSTMGDSTLNNNTTIFSQLRSGILVSREDLTLLFLTLIGIFMAVFVALMSLLLSVTDNRSRISMETASMFVGVTSLILVTSLSPVGVITVGHLITIVGLLIISLCILETVIAINYHKNGKEKLTRRLDLRTMPILAVGFIIIVISIIAFATWG